MQRQTRNKIIAFSIPLVILLGMTVSPVLTVLMGEEIKLETKPVDPRDLFRGDYVTLSYEAEEVHESKLDQKIKDHFLNDNGASYGDKSMVVYSILNPDKSGVYHVEKVVVNKPDSGIYLEGVVDYIFLDTANQTVHIDYELDKFFVPENTGTVLEDAMNDMNPESGESESNAVATVKVRSGHAILTSVNIKE